MRRVELIDVTKSRKKKGERERLIERRLIDQTIVNQRILMGETRGRAEEKRHNIIAE